MIICCKDLYPVLLSVDSRSLIPEEIAYFIVSELWTTLGMDLSHIPQDNGVRIRIRVPDILPMIRGPTCPWKFSLDQREARTGALFFLAARRQLS